MFIGTDAKSQKNIILELEKLFKEKDIRKIIDSTGKMLSINNNITPNFNNIDLNNDEGSDKPTECK